MCDERERLIGYVYGESDPDDRRAIERHLDDCEVCRVEIRDLRRTREDLLAWDVPEHGSVWTPFAPPAPPAWYRQVPAWAMAAAASLMFVAGATGGAVTHAWLGAAAPAATTAAVAEPGVRSVVPVAADELPALEQRLASLLRQELDTRLAVETANLASREPMARRVADEGISAEALRDFERTQAQRLDDLRNEYRKAITLLIDDVGRISETSASGFQRVDQRLSAIQGAVATNASARNPGNQ